MIDTMKFNNKRMEASAKNGFTNATDAADYLVKRVFLSEKPTVLSASLFLCASRKILHLMTFHLKNTRL